MDLTKTRMQLMPKGTSPIAVAKDVIAKDGIKGLYAGCVVRRSESKKPARGKKNGARRSDALA